MSHALRAIDDLFAAAEHALVPASGGTVSPVPKILPAPIGVGPLKPLAPPAFAPSPAARQAATPPSTPAVIDPTAPTGPVKPTLASLMPVPRFAQMRPNLLVSTAETLFREFVRAEQFSLPALAQARESFVVPITDKSSALLAVSSYEPAQLAELPLTYSQINLLLGELCTAVARYGVTPPDSWSQPVPDSLVDTENGDIEH